MAEATDRYPTVLDLRQLVRRAIRSIDTDVGGETGVRFAETGYGCACHVAGVDGPGGTSFLAIDVDRRTPEIYFDAAAARGRDPVTQSRATCSIAHVIDGVLSNPGRARRYLSQRLRRVPKTDGGVANWNASTPEGHPLLELSETDLQSRLGEVFHERCQFLHGDAVRHRLGSESDRLEEFRRQALRNDKLGQQYGWRMAAIPIDRWPDVPLELVVRESFRQVGQSLRG